MKNPVLKREHYRIVKKGKPDEIYVCLKHPNWLFRQLVNIVAHELVHISVVHNEFVTDPLAILISAIGSGTPKGMFFI